MKLTAAARLAAQWEKVFKLEARADLADLQDRYLDAHRLYREAGALREKLCK